MASQAWLIFTPEQNAQVLADSEATNFKIEPRLVDGNYVANLGEPLFAQGNFVAPARVLVDPEYVPVWAGTWVAELPTRNGDGDILFLPSAD